MVLEMDRAKRALRCADLRGERCQGGGFDLLFRECPIERGLVRDQLLANRDRFSLHGVKQLADTLALFAIELQLVRQLQDVRWAGVAVELTGQGKSHTAASLQISNLLVTQSLHRTLLQARIGCLAVLMLRDRGACQRQYG